MIHQVKIFNLIEDAIPEDRRTFVIRLKSWARDYYKDFGLPTNIAENISVDNILMFDNTYVKFKKTHTPEQFGNIYRGMQSVFTESRFFKYLLKKHIG